MAYRSRWAPQSTGKSVEITDKRIDGILAPIDRYQCLDTAMLLAINRGHLSKDAVQQALKLFYHEDNSSDGGRYLSRKRFRSDNPRTIGHSPDVHLLTDIGSECLNRTLPHRPAPITQYGSPTSQHFRHKVFEASFLASFFELGVKNSAAKSYFWYDILRSKRCPEPVRALGTDAFSIPLPSSRNLAGKQTHLRPDNLFGLHYPPYGPTDWRFFAVEIDCGTEPHENETPRNSSISKKFKDCLAVFDEKIFKKHLGIPNLYVLFVTDRPIRKENMRAALKRERPNAVQFGFKHFTFERPSSLVPKPDPTFFSSPWLTVNGEDNLTDLRLMPTTSTPRPPGGPLQGVQSSPRRPIQHTGSGSLLHDGPQEKLSLEGIPAAVGNVGGGE